MHSTDHPKSAERVKLRDDVVALRSQPALSARTVKVMDWADRFYGCAWRDAATPPDIRATPDFAASVYSVRMMSAGLPDDDEVVACRDGGRIVLVHASEIA